VARVGRPHAVGSGSVLAASHWVGGFAIADHEVTVNEFLRFLNAKDVSEEWKKKSDQVIWNRTRGHSMWNQLRSMPDGTFDVDPGVANYPASGVSFLQAQAYADWLTARSARNARPLRFAIPTDLEWEKAARGADGRAYAYGNGFHPLWQNSGRSRIRMAPEKVMSFPVDESPYGVYDLTGSQMEWCDRSEATRDPGDERTARGTAWSMADERRLYQETPLPMDVVMAEGGFRLVIRQSPAESRMADSRAESR
jgi:formylglycine-generating enzyme required for sulfatase activity